jgi:hypothetical protein
VAAAGHAAGHNLTCHPVGWRRRRYKDRAGDGGDLDPAVVGAQRLAGDTPRVYHYGPDVRWIGMEVYQDGQLVVDWRSWHELFEARRSGHHRRRR